jgi:hypothetical protein
MAKRVLVLTLITLLVMSLSVFGAKAPKSDKGLRIMQQSENANYADESIVSKYLTTPEVKLIPPTAPFYTAGYTYYDYQSNDGQRRSIANDYSGTLHFTWMDLVGNDMTNNRYIDYNALYNYTTGPDLAPGGMHVTSAVSRGGYGGLDLLPATKGGREVLCYHLTNPTTPANAFWGTAISVEKVTAGLGQFNQFDIPDSCSGYAEKGEWPTMATAKLANGDTAFIHITHARGVTSAGNKIMGYVRCFEKPSNHDTLVCQSPGWVSPLLIQKSTKIVPNKVPYQYTIAQLGTGVIATSPVSHKVAIVWYQSWTSSQTQNELMYVESTNDGSDWIANPANFVPVQLTSYQAMGGTGSSYAYDDIAAVYDYNDNLNIMWTTTPGSNALDVSLWHWDATNGIRKAGAASASDVAPGAWNRLIAKFTLGVEYLPADPAYNYLYFNYTKFTDADIAADEYGNGDLYFKASSNGGKTWGPETNLTNSNTNGCSPPACSSEHWSSIAERVDSFQYVGYLLDHDAGGVPQDEGTFTLNEFALMKYPRALVPSVPSMTYSPSSMATPVEWAKNHSTTQDTVDFDNVGTASLMVQLYGPSWLTLSPSSFTIVEAGPSQSVTATLNGGPYADQFFTDSVKIVSNQGVVGGGPTYSDTQYIPIYFVVTDTFYYAEWDTCFRGTVLAASNVGNEGHQWDSTGMAYNGLNYLFDASQVMVTDQVPGHAGNMGFSYIHDKVDYLPERHVKKEDISKLKTTITYSCSAPITWRQLKPLDSPWSGWTVWDKVIQSEWTYLGKKRGVVIKEFWWKWNEKPVWWPEPTVVTAPVGGYFGIAGDWDVTADFSGKDMGGIIDSLNLVYLRQDSSATVGSGLDKYYGGFQYLGGYVKKGGDSTYYAAPFAMHVGNNATQMYPFKGYNDDSLMKYMSLPGDFIEQDSAQDMNIILSAIEMLNPDASTEIFIKVVQLVDDSNLVDFNQMARATYRTKPGDANMDFKVTVSDVVYLVNYLFKSGPEPWLLFSDANADKQVTVSDVVYLVNFLFKGGPAPKWLCQTILPPWPL